MALRPPVLYHASLEHADADEATHIRELTEVFARMALTVAEQEGHAHRAVHAKGQGLLKGRLRVLDELPAELRHGLFARPGSYDARVRLSSPPAEQLPDSVSTPRAMALKVIGVQGPRAEGAEEQHTQDFLMVNGPAFNTPGVAGFLRAAKLLAATTERMPRTKRMISATLRGAEAALEAVGGQSATLKGMGGEPQHHPLGETFFSQVPFLYGPYMAKFSLAPVSPALLALTGDRSARMKMRSATRWWPSSPTCPIRSNGSCACSCAAMWSACRSKMRRLPGPRRTARSCRSHA